MIPTLAASGTTIAVLSLQLPLCCHSLLFLQRQQQALARALRLDALMIPVLFPCRPLPLTCCAQTSLRSCVPERVGLPQRVFVRLYATLLLGNSRYVRDACAAAPMVLFRALRACVYTRGCGQALTGAYAHNPSDYARGFAVCRNQKSGSKQDPGR